MSLPGGTTVLAAIRQAAAKGTQVTFSKDGTGAAGRHRWGGGDRRAALRRRRTATAPIWHWLRRTWTPSPT